MAVSLCQTHRDKTSARSKQQLYRFHFHHFKRRREKRVVPFDSNRPFDARELSLVAPRWQVWDWRVRRAPIVVGATRAHHACECARFLILWGSALVKIILKLCKEKRGGRGMSSQTKKETQNDRMEEDGRSEETCCY